MTNDRGMTLVEMIAVLLLMAIVSAVVLNRFMDITAVSTTASVETVRAHLRYAQAMAMKQNNYLWGIKCDGAHYWLFRTESKDDYSTVQGDQDTPVYLPGEDDQKLPASGIGAFHVYYDAYGRPRQYDSGKTELLTAAVSITVGGETIQITPETGFIE
jgi:prepilin-type N-terminal cleavage/methylation domain-containing protein